MAFFSLIATILRYRSIAVIREPTREMLGFVLESSHFSRGNIRRVAPISGSVSDPRTENAPTLDLFTALRSQIRKLSESKNQARDYFCLSPSAWRYKYFYL
jgi:hypothetical protein